jgi:hypothetical protein
MEQQSLNLRTPKMHKRICENPDCGKEFVTKSAAAKFCTDQCRNAAWFKNQKQQRPSIESEDKKPAPEKSLTASFTNGSLPPQAVWIISELTRSRDLLQTQLNDEKTSRKEFQRQKLDLERQIEKIKFDHELEALKNAKPTGLNGLSENPFVLKVLEHVGPGLNAILMKYGQPGPDQLVAGTDGQLDGDQQNHLKQIVNWYTQLPTPLQNQVYLTIDAFAHIPNAQSLDASLKRIQNLLKNGTTATPIATPNGTFN